MGWLVANYKRFKTFYFLLFSYKENNVLCLKSNVVNMSPKETFSFPSLVLCKRDTRALNGAK